VLASAFVLVLTTLVVFAQPQKMTASEAFSAVSNDKLILLDIRSPGEWNETGVAQGAWPVTMHDPSFSTNLQRIQRQFPDTPIALICATGGRSNYVADVLEKNGLTGVIDVAEGMFGNGVAPGWIARDLPIVNTASAKASYLKSLLK
jgi:rhodanese-related sulfurtransferase